MVDAVTGEDADLLPVVDAIDGEDADLLPVVDAVAGEDANFLLWWMLFLVKMMTSYL
jgi:hypothetical protein